MSHVFRKYCLPLDNTSWKVWSQLGLMTDKDISILSVTQNVLNDKLSQDLIEYICYLVFKDGFLNTEPIYFPHIIRWLEYWVGDRLNQQHNPFIAVKNSTELANTSQYLKKLELDNCAVMIKSPLINLSQYNINNIGLMIGISFPHDYDVKDIESANIYCNNVALRSSFVFSDEYSFVSKDVDNKYHTFYYLPHFKVIPTYMMNFISMILYIQPKPGKLCPKYVTQMKIFNRDFTEHDIDTIIEIEKDDPYHHLLISDGIMYYKSII